MKSLSRWLFISIGLSPALAFAQYAAPAPTLAQQIEHWVMLAIAAGAVGLLFKALFGFLDSYDQRTQAAAAAPGASEVTRVKALVLHLVDTVAHGLVAQLEPELRAQAAAGKLDPTALLKDGMAELKQLITVDHASDIKQILGVAETMLWPYLEKLLAARLHVALAGFQETPTGVSAAPAPAPAKPAAAPTP